MKNSIALKTLLLSAGVFVSLSVSAQKHKFIEGKKYDVNFYEVKPAGRGKAVASNFLVKGGKIESDLMYEKIALGPATYKVILDSTYTEDETEMHLLKIEAELQEEKNEYKWEVTVINYDIEGTVVQLKSGVEKKKFEFDGTEKAKKK
jgi:hypothetical protein